MTDQDTGATVAQRPPGTLWQVWKQGDADFDECSDSELLGTFYSKARAQVLLLKSSKREYQGYVTENARQLAEALAKAGRMTDFAIAYCDWEQAARLAPSKELRVIANTMVQLVRHMRPRPDLDHDWRQIAANIIERSGLSHEQWVEQYGNHSLRSLSVDDAR